jgi:heat shock protein HtpX
MKNGTKVWLFLIALSLCSLIFGYKVGDRLGLLFTFLTTLAFLTLIVTSSPAKLLKKLNATELHGQDPWNLNERAVDWAHRLGMRAPRVFVMNQPTASAFSLGHPWRTPVVCLSSGLLKKLSQEEVDAVLVYQICHIFRTDTFVFGISSILADSLMSLAEFLDFWWPPKHWKKLNQWKNQKPFSLLIAPLAWLFIRLNVQDRSYFENDDLVVRILPNRKLLAQVLWKLDSFNQARPLNIPDCTSHLFLVNPRGLKNTHWFYTTHPKMNLRLKRLIGTEYF